MNIKGRVLKGVNYKMVIAETRIGNIIVACRSLPATDENMSIHAEQSLISFCREWFGCVPPYIKTMRMTADGELCEAVPCLTCALICQACGINTVQIDGPNGTRTCILKQEISNGTIRESSANRQWKYNIRNKNQNNNIICAM